VWRAPFRDLQARRASVREARLSSAHFAQGLCFHCEPRKKPAGRLELPEQLQPCLTQPTFVFLFVPFLNPLKIYQLIYVILSFHNNPVNPAFQMIND
jgi:hypothetical protein